MNRVLCGDIFVDFLKTIVISGPEIWWHTYANQQHANLLPLSEFDHLPQVIGSLPEIQTSETIIATQFYNQVAGLVLSQQARQALQPTIGSFTAYAGIYHA